MSALTIPTVPSLPAGYVVQQADMQNLAAACTFLLSRPMTRIRDGTGGVAIGTSPTLVTFTTASFDVDGMWNVSTPSQLTIQTPGWYKVRYGVNIGSGANVCNSYVTSTTGSNNPAGIGVTSAPYWSGYSDTNAASNDWATGVGVWPFALYTGDFLQVSVWADSAGNSTGTGAPGAATLGGSYFSLEYVSVM